MDPQQRLKYRMMAQVLAAAGHETRLAILDFLAGGEQCVCDIAAYVGAERSNVSRHLAMMLHAGLVAHRKDGLKMMYTLRTPCILNIMPCVVNVVRRQADQAGAVLECLNRPVGRGAPGHREEAVA